MKAAALSPEILISKAQIDKRIEETAKILNEKYKDLTIVVVLKGGVMVATDLLRNLTINTDIEFVRCKSYKGTERGKLTIENLENLDFKGKNVLVVDDIFDSGKTLESIMKAMAAKGCATLSSLVLLEKDVPHVTEYRADHVLFTIPNKFVVGYGMDYDERYRGLQNIQTMR
ncbi:MAG: Hypoxanthine phosphoribosyltransferase [Chlamydiia bacterium]|nr:Hypoxanthine phosphoribosyltransferase [Chlamydiia bacterium]MCH9615178.1 Hypoxanthine phosphoribosyltransferase [Chlamydiia bacterium]MCH9628500.1 Hypoxanthine phosphoribosyltransferase [Chlamydiia bacterium]